MLNEKSPLLRELLFQTPSRRIPRTKLDLVLIDEPCIEEIAAMHADVIFPALHGPYGEGGPLQMDA